MPKSDQPKKIVGLGRWSFSCWADWRSTTPGEADQLGVVLLNMRPPLHQFASDPLLFREPCTLPILVAPQR